MTRNISLILLTCLWLGAAVVLATPSAHTSHGVRVAAVIVTGFPGAVAAIWSFLRLIGRPPVRTKLKVKWMLKSALIEIYRGGQHRGDISQVSLHVWMIPLFWRILPRRIRRRSRATSRLPGFVRARLVRLTSYRLEHKERLNVSSFRMGIGLIGICAAENKESKVHVVRFYEDAFQAAIKDPTA